MTLATAFDSIVLDGDSRTNASTLTFTVTFTGAVQGLSASSFSLDSTGTLAGASVDSVIEKTAGDATTYTVAVTAGTGDGSLTLVLDPAGLTDLGGNPVAFGASGLQFSSSIVSSNANVQASVLADLNGDGKADLVTGNYAANQVSVLLNNGDGTFSAHTDYATGTKPLGLAAADVNGDGLADIITANNSGNSVSVLLNNGDGTFAAKADYSTVSHAEGVAVADLNGDGKADIVTGTAWDNTAQVLLNNGDGTFTAGTIYSDLGSVVALGDVDGDGKADLVVGSQGTGNISVMLGNGNGTFAPKVEYTGGGVGALALADVNGDGKLDIVTSKTEQTSNVSVLLNNGNGTFSPKTDYDGGYYVQGLAVGDVNGDGKADIVTTDYDQNLPVLLNNGDGTFAPRTGIGTIANSAYSVGIADLNGDANADIVVSAYDGTSSVLLRQTSASSEPVTIDHTDATGIAFLLGAPAANATTLTFGLAFSEELAGLDAADFALVRTGTANGTITGFSGAGGSYTVTVSGITGTGSLAIELASGATVTDLAGNAVSLAPVAAHALDTEPPAAPTLRTPHALTTETQPIFAGLAEAGSTVKLYDTNGTTLIGSVVADSNGNWVLRRTAVALSDGQHIVTATATDAAGNVSAVALPVSVTVDTIAPNAPIITSAALTSSASPVLAGTAEALSTVKVYDGAALLGTVTANGSGLWSLPLTTPLAEGPHSISAIAWDAVGHSSPASLVQPLVVDLTAPAAPSLDALPALGNAVISTLSGTAEAGATVEVFDGSHSLGTAVANIGGTWSLPLGTPLTDGSYSLTATATDPAGNASSASAAVAVAVDTQAPGAPSLVAPPLTNDSTPSLSGTAEAGATVEVFDGIVSLGSATANESGAWMLDVASPLAEGGHSLTAVATDAAGNASVASAQVALSVDSVAPAAPTLDMVSQANLDSTPVFFGTAEPLSFVDIYDGETLVQRTQADANGDWWLVMPAALVDGEHAVTAVAVDAAGNSSASSEILPVVINAEPPAPPAISAGASPTNASIASLAGTAEAGSTVEVFDGVVSLGTVSANESGAWTLTLGAPLSEGPHALTAVATDLDGMVSDPSAPLLLLVDQTAPASPALDILPALANLPLAVLSGTAEIGSTVEVFDGATSLGTATANGGGTWSLTLGTLLGEGSHSLTAVATDAAGNGSTPSGEMAVAIDLTAPDAPAFDALAPLTNDATPTLTGTAEAGSTVEVFDGETSLGTVAVSGEGIWSFIPETALADGRHSFTALAFDAAGNLSDASAAALVTVDTTADAGAQATLVAQSALVEAAAAKAVTYTVHGLDADATAVATFTDGVTSVHAAVAVNGLLTVDLSSLVNGKVTSSLAISDAAGNTAEATGDTVTFLRADENPFVDDLYYLQHNPDVAASGMDPDEHYALFGWKEGRDPNAEFSTVAYLAANRDVAEAGINPLEHFLQYGEKEGRDPSVNFDVQAYLEHNPDVAAAGMGALEHYLLFGRDEGRAAYAETTPNMASGFDASYYLAANPDVAASGMDPLQHFLQFGLFEGRQPSGDLLG